MQSIPYSEVKAITISGGEPFEQAEELACLLSAAREAGLHRLVYTGFTYEELRDIDDKAVRKSLLLTDMLIDGAYQQNNVPKEPWTGSGNQRIIILNNGSIETYHGSEYSGDVEILINEAGMVEVTGIIDSRAWEEV
jgi:anaerobic ribonucleoside-triphosphate reductase activating protein